MPIAALLLRRVFLNCLMLTRHFWLHPYPYSPLFEPLIFMPMRINSTSKFLAFIMNSISRLLTPPVMTGVISLTLSIPAPAALLAFYDFDGNANDRSVNAIHPTTQNNITQVAGHEGQAYAFNGLNSYIEIPLNINPANYPSLTMGAWVKSNNASAIKKIISHDNGTYDRTLGIDNRGGGVGWSAFTGTGSVLGFQAVNIGTWTFVAVSYDQAALTATLHVNGNSFTETASLSTGFSFTRIGSNPGYGEYFDGVIDNVFFFDEALSTSRITEIRLNGASAIPEPSSAVLGFSSLALLALRRRRA